MEQDYVIDSYNDIAVADADNAAIMELFTFQTALNALAETLPDELCWVEEMTFEVDFLGPAEAFLYQPFHIVPFISASLGSFTDSKDADPATIVSMLETAWDDVYTYQVLKKKRYMRNFIRNEADDLNKWVQSFVINFSDKEGKAIMKRFRKVLKSTEHREVDDRPTCIIGLYITTDNGMSAGSLVANTLTHLKIRRQRLSPNSLL